MEIRSFLDVLEFGARLDWLTFTASPIPAEAAEFHRFARHYMERERERWGNPKERKLGAYAGTCIADTSFLHRPYDKHEMLVCIGEHSNRLAEELIIHEVPGRVRRVDARILARANTPNFNYPEDVRNAVIAAGTKEGKERRKKISLFGSTRGSDGAAIGSRSSQRFVRIYDHDAKHNGGATGLNYAHEGEFKAESAEAFFSGYKSAEKKPQYIAGVMRNTLNSMRVPCDWLQDVEAVSVVVGRKITTNEKRLAYQKKIGVPMLQHLIAEGCKEEVKALLVAHGIDETFFL